MKCLLQQFDLAHTALVPGLGPCTLIQQTLAISEKFPPPAITKITLNKMSGASSWCSQAGRSPFEEDVLILLHGLHLDLFQVHQRREDGGGLLGLDSIKERC
jgi:hypothetical protein